MWLWHVRVTGCFQPQLIDLSWALVPWPPDSWAGNGREAWLGFPTPSPHTHILLISQPLHLISYPKHHILPSQASLHSNVSWQKVDFKLPLCKLIFQNRTKNFILWTSWIEVCFPHQVKVVFLQSKEFLCYQNLTDCFILSSEMECYRIYIWVKSIRLNIFLP